MYYNRIAGQAYKVEFVKQAGPNDQGLGQAESI